MKTTIIQDDSNEPKPERSETTGDVGVRRHPTNLAGRMGRWSAHHRKTAIFGWLAFVVVAFVVGTRHRRKEVDRHVGPGRVRAGPTGSSTRASSSLRARPC